MPQKVSHISLAFRSFMWDGVSVFPTGIAKTGDICGILLFQACDGGRLLCKERRPVPAAQDMMGTVSLLFLALHPLCRILQERRALRPVFPYFQGASAPHCIHWTAGKLQLRLQSEHGVRGAADAECSFQDGHAQRSRRREQREQPGGGVRTRMPEGGKDTKCPGGSRRRLLRAECSLLHPKVRTGDAQGTAGVVYLLF